MKKIVSVFSLVVVLVLLMAAVGSAGAKPSATVNVQILALNDFHGNLLPPGNFGTTPAGGVEFLATHINSLRTMNPNTVVVSAGDMIGASPLISALFHDEPTIEAFNTIGLDFNAVGNHEFDEGVYELIRMQEGGCHPVDGCLDGDGFTGAEFRYLAANVTWKKNDKPIFPAFKTRSFNGVQIAFIGMTLEGTPTIVTPSGIVDLNFLDEADTQAYALAGQVVRQYLDISLAQTENLEEVLLDVRAPASAPANDSAESPNLLLRIVSPIMGGMLVFYAFFTGTSTAQSILKEEEERTLPRLFTTPTPQATILSGKFLAVFLTVLVQVVVLLVAARLIFGIQWGDFLPAALTAVGTVFSASSFGIFVNSFLKNTRQGGVLFGGVLTMTGMIGMIGIFAMNSPAAARLGDTVSLLVPQGWAVHGLLQAMNGQPVTSVLTTALVMLAWSATFFAIGVWRFNKRYA